MAAVGVLALAGAGVGAGAVLARDGDAAPADADRAVARLSTTTVEQRDITTYDDTTATLTFRRSVSVASPVDGTVTSLLGEGDTVDAGTVVATVDGAPVVALLGDVPGWRTLSADVADGVDVRQLEQNLVALGYDPEGAIVIDETFDDATVDAVNAWEAVLGLEGDGEVPASQVVFVPGRLLVDEVGVAVGEGATRGEALLTGRQSERRLLVSTPGGGTVTRLAVVGTAVTTGTVLFARNGIPVVAIEGDASAVPALTRELAAGADEGADVRLLERMLRAGGFDPDSAMTVDDTFDDATATAVLRFWQSVDPAIVLDPADLTVPVGSFVVVPAALRVGTALVAEGATLVTDGVVLTLTEPARTITTTAPVGDDTFVVGTGILVAFPDGSTQDGTVVEVGNVATLPQGQAGGADQTPTVSIDIEVPSIPASVESFVSVPVTLRVVADEVKGALVAPVSALVALAEGGYALEVVDGTAADGSRVTRLMGVETGLFADGFVVLTGRDLRGGLEVVVPS